MVRTISKFSGKCDVYDWVSSPSCHLSNLMIYVGESKEPIKIEYLTDIIPYYPHIVSIGYHNNETKEDIIRITPESYVEIRERERLQCMLEEIKNIYQRCLKNNELFIIDNVVEEMKTHYLSYDLETHRAIKELAERVYENRFTTDISGISFSIFEHYKQELFKEMVDSGAYTEEEAKKWIWKTKN